MLCVAYIGNCCSEKKRPIAHTENPHQQLSAIEIHFNAIQSEFRKRLVKIKIKI
jgi:hypothetical protein